MSYCRFENTTDDLIDCLDALREAGTVEELKETRSSKTEAQHVDVLIDVCRDIINEINRQEAKEKEYLIQPFVHWLEERRTR